MGRWKGSSVLNRSTTQQPTSYSEKSRVVEEVEVEEDDGEDEELALDYINYNDWSLNAHLLFTKESISAASKSGPLFQNPSRRTFFIMACKRTIFACRGLFLLLFVVFIVISVVASFSSHNSSEGSNGTHELTSETETENQQLSSFPLPKVNGNGNTSEIKVKFNSNCGYKTSDYSGIGNSIRKGIEFFERNLNNITVLDAALGSRILAEQIKLTLQRHSSLPVEIKAILADHKIRAEVLTEQITETVIRATNDTKDLKFTLPWVRTKDLWQLPINGDWYEIGSLSSYNPPDGESFEDIWDIANEREIFDESVSDTCIFQVFHCKAINITQECRDAFLKTIGSMYSLTHQVIYMLLAQKNECFEEPSWKEVTGIQDNGFLLMEQMCGKVWQEANSIADANYPPRFRDLLAEQIGMCALAGYPDLLRRDWLRRLISWQSRTTSGCFGERRRRLPTIGLLLNEYKRWQKNYLQRSFDDRDDDFGAKWRRSKGKRRYKRSDIFLENNDEKCSVHFTAVGLTAYSLHLHYFFDKCFSAYV